MIVFFNEILIRALGFVRSKLNLMLLVESTKILWGYFCCGFMATIYSEHLNANFGMALSRIRSSVLGQIVFSSIHLLVDFI